MLSVLEFLTDESTVKIVFKWIAVGCGVAAGLTLFASFVAYIWMQIKKDKSIKEIFSEFIDIFNIVKKIKDRKK